MKGKKTQPPLSFLLHNSTTTMGAVCTTASSAPAYNHHQQAARRQTLTKQPPNYPNPHRELPQLPPILLDSETHTIHTLTGSRFQILPKASEFSANSGSPTKRPTSTSIVPGGVPRQISAKKRNLNIGYRDLMFKQVLGQGTYGEVHRGYWKGRKVAVKKIFPGTTKSQRIEVVSDFDREITILSKLDNKCSRICSFLGYVNEANQPLCLVFELCEGSVSTLLKMVRQKYAQVSWRVCLGILHDAAEACAFLHSQGVIHRDLKGENLLLESNFRCKLTDFGLSRELVGTKRQVMTVCGTPCWVAPEIFRNDPYDEKVDVYSFAILIWEIMASRKPYADNDGLDLTVQVGRKGLRPARLQNVPEELHQLMTQCWQEEPSKRPDFQYVMRALENVTLYVDQCGKLVSPVHTTGSWRGNRKSLNRHMAAV